MAKASAFEVLRLAERIELATAGLYRAVGEHFPWSPEERQVLKSLEDEEHQHASRVRLFRARYLSDRALFDLTALKLEPLEALERDTEELLARVVGGAFEGDHLRLKRCLYDLEDRASIAHAEAMAAGAHPAVARFMRALADQDRAHRDLLFQFCEGRPSPAGA